MVNIKKIVTALCIFLGLFFFAVPAIVSADAQSDIQCGVNAAAGGSGCSSPANNTGSLNNTVANIINILSILVGVIAVVMIIVGGFRYVTSAGKDESVKSAKNTVLYAVIGLVIVALAQIIVRFVLTQATTPSH